MKRTARWMEQWNMWPPAGGKLLCAVSGGRDSMAMLHILCSLAQEQGVLLGVAHFNHGIRGENALRDEKFVESYCKEKGIACFVGRGDVPAAAKQQGWTLEEAARNLRYAFLEETARSWGAERIALAHHADDNAETLLLNLIRGSGLRGLGGIAPVREQWIRPLLHLSRREIENYIEENRIPFVEDESNADESLTRNFLRRQVLPVLEQAQPRAAEHMAQTALRLRQDEALLQRLAAECLTALRCEKGELTLPAAEFYAAPRPLQLRMLQQLLQKLQVGEKDITARHLESVLQLDCGGSVTLPRGLRIWRRDQWLHLRVTESPEECALQPEQWCAWGAWQLLLTADTSLTAEEELHLSAECMSAAVTVGPWKGPDRLFLPENRGSRSIKRLLQDQRVQPKLRESLPLLRVNGRAAALYPVGTDKAFLPPEGEEGCRVLLRQK